MRLYTFINCYLSSIQQGIQTAHIVSELMGPKVMSSSQVKMIHDWAKDHKTIIVCNGGNNESIEGLVRFFDLSMYPHSTFYEDKDSLCGALTGVGIILPEAIYGAEANVSRESYDYYGGPSAIRYEEGGYEYELIKRIKSYRLAN